jgi:hypothetical protein
MEVEQPVRLSRAFSVSLYALFSLFFFLGSELALLLLHPFRMPSSLFLAEFEIFRSFVFGSLMGVMNLVTGALVIVNNSVSFIGILLIVVSSTSLILNIMFVMVYSADDRSSFLSSFVANCLISSHAPRLCVEGENNTCRDEFPFYRTLRYRREVDVQAEKNMTPFQILQLVNNLRVNPRLHRIFFSYQNGLSTASARLLAQYIRTSRSRIQINNLDLEKVLGSESIVVTPDSARVRALFSPQEHGLVPWDTKRVRWQDGLPWTQKKSDDSSRLMAPELFSFMAALLIALADRGKLEELDLGSNNLTDQVSWEIAELILKAEKLAVVELGGNSFTIEGFKRIIGAIIHNPTVLFVRLSTVVVDIQLLRSSRIIDLSLPALYSRAVSRTVDALFEACSTNSDLTGSFTTAPVKLNKSEQLKYFEKLYKTVANDFIGVGRELYRSVTPLVAELCVARTAHRLGKHILPDPGDTLDLSAARSIDGSVAKERDVMEEKMYMSFLSEGDVVLISSMVEMHNDEIEEIDFRGIPLSGSQMGLLLRSLVTKHRLRSVNFGFCMIKDSNALADLLNFLRNCSQTLAEVNLKGNPAFAGKKDHIWTIIDSFPRACNPRVIVDNFW